MSECWSASCDNSCLTRLLYYFLKIVLGCQMVFGANTHRPVLGWILAELEFVVLLNLVRSVDLKIAIPEINLKFLPGFFKNLERF